MPLAPPPVQDSPGSFAWLEWYRQLRNYITQSGSVPWNIINFAGSNITDIISRSHQNLQALQGGTTSQYYHLTQSKHGEVNNNLNLAGTSGTGLKVDLTTPTFGWRDLEGPIGIGPTAAGRPNLTTYDTNVEDWAFSAGDHYGPLKFHIPHDYVPGSDIYIHVHWSHNGTNISGSLVCTYYFTYAKGHNQQNFFAEKSLTQTISSLNITNTPSKRHRIDEIQLSAASPSASQIDSDDLETDGLILMHFDVPTIPTITGGSGEPFIHYVDIHYQSTSLPTKNKAPNFYI